LFRKKSHIDLYRGSGYVVNFLPHLKLELVLKDDQLTQALDAIMLEAWRNRRW
jgi:nitrogen regulatory protein PII